MVHWSMWVRKTVTQTVDHHCMWSILVHWSGPVRVLVFRLYVHISLNIMHYNLCMDAGNYNAESVPTADETSILYYKPVNHSCTRNPRLQCPSMVVSKWVTPLIMDSFNEMRYIGYEKVGSFLWAMHIDFLVDLIISFAKCLLVHLKEFLVRWSSIRCNGNDFQTTSFKLFNAFPYKWITWSASTGELGIQQSKLGKIPWTIKTNICFTTGICISCGSWVVSNWRSWLFISPRLTNPITCNAFFYTNFIEHQAFWKSWTVST